MIQTKFQELIGTKYPIIQAGMGPYSTTELSIAVAKAGALGLISTIGMAGGSANSATPERSQEVFGRGRPRDIVKRVIQYVYDNLKDHPDAKFGMNTPVAVDFDYAARRLIKGMIEILTENPEMQKKFKVIVTSAGDPLPYAVDAKAKGMTLSTYLLDCWQKVR